MRHLPLEDGRQARDEGQTHVERWPDDRPRVHGYLLDGRRSGVWTRWYQNGRRAEENTYRDGRLHGPTTSWWEDGRVKAELHYADGRLHGPFATWHANGNMSEEGEWIDGLPHRDYVRFWPNGRRRMIGVLEHGRPTGLWKVFSHQGVLMYGGEWDPDLLEWLTPWIRAAVEGVTGGHPVLARAG